MKFQVTVLKILVSYPDGFAPMTELKRDMAILATSGRDWAKRTKRLAARVPNLDIFSQQLIERVSDGWRITQKGRAVLNVMEAPTIPAEQQVEMEAAAPESSKPMLTRSLPFEAGRRQEHQGRRLTFDKRRRSTRS
ncbi:hypothetical protein A5906_09595 [Bradyrhizobium sacchari]|uniref:hypothetical protein n=1 Tax=Bradyrhizobium sacchari TaxID=1399419 RepID=UPI0009B0F8FC|nr:hypothetical protein [Bradyrhizobium sacchari]OPY95229.1 hypothetical protein A5906_09595 [Bradyrhizobium sacchari]